MDGYSRLQLRQKTSSMVIQDYEYKTIAMDRYPQFEFSVKLSKIMYEKKAMKKSRSQKKFRNRLIK